VDCLGFVKGICCNKCILLSSVVIFNNCEVCVMITVHVLPLHLQQDLNFVHFKRQLKTFIFWELVNRGTL